MNIQTVKLDDLVSEGLQVRCSTNKDVAAECAEAIKDGAKFPPVIVYRQSAGSAKAPSGKYLLVDGYHRVYAARELGLVEIEADVREGGYNEARRFALRANTAHGLRLTNADKSRARTRVEEQERTLQDLPRAGQGRQSERTSRLEPACAPDRRFAAPRAELHQRDG